ncbi:hypothetical protein FHY52_06045 [Nocardia nova]|uniref:hypothetical protein n=1 Tax=Nocardia nova TaxID=37330 RepID=UPI0025AF2F01|nr:hypothetical protein [Nocardia nova]MDN2496256.1 hypothetical protein [Nocardia nova]
MSEPAERLLRVRTATLQWLYNEMLAGRPESSPTPSSIAGYVAPDELPAEEELGSAIRWLMDMGYASGTPSWQPGAERLLRITPRGERVATFSGTIYEAEQPTPQAPTVSTVYNIQQTRDVAIAHESDRASQSMTGDADNLAGSTGTETRRHRAVMIATWTGSIAGVISVVVALGVWAPWKTHSAASSATSSTSSTPFTWTTDRQIGSCGTYLFRKSIAELGPPPPRQNWAKWVRDNKGIDAGNYGVGTVSRVSMTLAGLSKNPVTLTGLSIEAVDRKPGGITGTTVSGECGSDTTGRIAEVDLDATPPKIIKSADDPNTIWGAEENTTPLKFPYKITDTDTETFMIIGETKNYVAWRIHVRWSNGKDSGEAVIDDNGSPFETSPPATGSQRFFPNGSTWQPR